MSITLNWQNPNPLPLEETSVLIFRDTATLDPDDLPAPLDTLAPGALYYEDTTAADGVLYHYIVGYTYGANTYLSAQISVIGPTGVGRPDVVTMVNTSIDAGVVMNAQLQVITGKVPFYVYGDWHSTRKLLACLVIDRYKHDVLDTEEVTVTAADLATTSSPWLSGFADGDILTWRQIMSLMLVPSMSDIAATTERVLGGELLLSEKLGSSARQALAIAMAFEARLAQCDRTIVFTNAAGVTGEVVNTPMIAQPSDLAKMAMYASMNPTVLAICQQASISITCTGPSPKTLAFNSMDYLLAPRRLNNSTLTNVPFPGHVLGKTGDSSSTRHMAWVAEAASGQRLCGVVRQASQQISRVNSVIQSIMDVESRFAQYRKSEVNADPDAASVVLHLIGGDGVDHSPAARNITNSGVASVSTPHMHGTALEFTGTNYLDLLDKITLGSDDFTMEAFMQGAGNPNNTGTFFTHWNQGVSGGRMFSWNIDSSTNFDYATSSLNRYSVDVEATHGDTLNGMPSHVVLQRRGSSFIGFLNGIPGSIHTRAGALWQATADVQQIIGGRFNGTTFENVFRGLVHEFKITMGVARYSEDGFRPYFRPNRWG